MFIRFYQFFCILNLALIQIKCNNLYVHPKTVYVTGGLAGGKIAISCINILDGHEATFANGIEWIKLNTLSIISSNPEARVRRDGHRLLFDSTDCSDEGLYCCRSAAENHGCSYNSTVRIFIARTQVCAPAKNLMRNSDSRHNIVTKSTSSGMVRSITNTCMLNRWLSLLATESMPAYMHITDIMSASCMLSIFRS